MSEIKIISIPHRDANGFLIGFKRVNALWNCPTCGEAMGEPKLTSHAEDGYSGSVHIWTNPCGHVVHYKDLKTLV
ncbi:MULTISPECIES: hypothetical protein [Bacillus]|uniref:Uncharacterized protein n=1 Tax=Bacillus glycinifermentans TaxID=1664069 RepID=A0A0T6BIA4_9BACI|nr:MULTISPECIES: hypothetical protein [Bacillus]KRT87119.1 hypothetical protein AB447_209125 [Bacillus glycinifermentans]MEC0341993.1 hypothetical protein [Bacillus sonorensis]MEC0457493.1 hypothetical protein [Bacillus sonorensis]MEC0487170.1 hypothetical protein [Bacillus glycinifermentans]MEC0530712.1 hypothetical protein [Bacillus sonorensis]